MKSQWYKEVVDEMVQREIGSVVWQFLKEESINYEEISRITSVRALSDIREVLARSDYDTSDREIVEQIVRIFEKYGLDTGCVHEIKYTE